MRTLLTTMLLLSTVGSAHAWYGPQTAPPGADAGQVPASPQTKGKPQTPQKAKPKLEENSAAPPSADAPKPVKAADEPAAPIVIKSKLAPPSTLYTEFGLGDWGLSGSRSKFRQYATPAHGFTMRDFRYAPMLKSPADSAFFDLKGIGGEDYRAESRLSARYGATQASGFLSRFQFETPLQNPVGASSRDIQGFSAKQSLNRDFALSVQFRNDSQRNKYEVPYSNLDQNTQYWDAFAAGKLGRGFATVNYSELQFADHTVGVLNTTTKTSGLSYLWSPSDLFDVEAAYSHVAISQPTLPQSHLDIMSLTGAIAVNPTTDLNLRLQQRNVGMPTVQSAYVRAQSLGSVSLFHRWKSWRAQAGFRLQEDERVNGGQTYVDVPKWSTVEGRISGKLMDGWRLTVRGYVQSLFNPPSAITEDTNSLFWNGRNYLQAKLEGGPPEVSYYLIYTYQANRNSARAAEVKTGQYTAGGVWQVSPTVSLFGEYHHESWSGHTDFDIHPTLSNFLPNSTTGLLELTWNQRRFFMSASYTTFTERNDNPLLLPDGNANGNYVTLNGRYRFPRGYDLGLMVAPWYYRDKVATALDYRAAVVMLTGSARY